MRPVYIATIVFLVVVGGAHGQSLFRVPYVGGVTDRSGIVLVWLEAPGTFKVEYGTDQGLVGSTQSSEYSAEGASDNVVKVELGGLAAATRYYYRITTTTGTPISRVQSFTTFPTAGEDGAVTIFFGSCQQSLPTDSGKVFDVAADLGGDLFVQLGDWAYPDIRVPGYPSTDSLVRAGYALRLDTAYPFPRRVLSQMSLAYEWDDHDAYGDNSNGDVSPELKQRVYNAYDRYVPHHGLVSPDGIWHSFVVGNVEIFMLDSRSQRSPVDSAFKGNTFSPPPGHSMLAGSQYPHTGTDQRNWLMNAVRKSKARWKIIATQVPFNPAMAQGISLAAIIGRKDIAKRFAEYWAGYPADVDSIKTLIREGKLRNALVISGSVHTNMYDNGSHSLIPEFVAANLDIENTHLRDTLKKYSLDVWTAGQTDNQSTVGRIRVETSPKHRLVVESFGEDGTKILSLIIVDATSGSVPVEPPKSHTTATGEIHNGRLQIHLSENLVGEGTLTIYAIDGRTVAEIPITIAGKTTEIALPGSIPTGTYVGRLNVAGEEVKLIISNY